VAAISIVMSTHLLAVAAAALRLPPPRCNSPRMQSYGDTEAAAQWYRTGKDTKRWAPGDKTGNPSDDARLLWSSWTLNPLTLHVNDDCADCTLARIVLSHLGMPFVTEEAEDALFVDGEQASELPVLAGAGVPAPAGLTHLPHPLEICSFAASVCKTDARIAPATGREDVAAWIDCVDEFVEFSDSCTPELVLGLAAQLGKMLRGTTEEGLPCLNAWGFSMDDAMVLAALRNLEAAAPDGAGLDAWPPPPRDYLEGHLERVGVPPLDLYYDDE